MALRSRALSGLCGVLCVLATACGPDSKDAPSSGTTGTSGAGAAGASGTAGSGNPGGSATSTGGTATTGGTSAGGSATGGTSSAGSGATNTATGTIQIGRLLNATTGGGMQTSASFSNMAAASTVDCVQERFGECTVSTCTPNGNTPSTAPAPTAGTITITDGAMLSLTLSAAPGQPYSLQPGSTGTLAGGELLTVTAAGADVPAFTANIAVPRVITISAPALDENGNGTVPASGDLRLTFDNRMADGETGTQLHVLDQTSGPSSLYCTLPTETGSATIPAAALDKVRSSGGQLLLLVARTKQASAGDFTVNLISFMSAMNTAKSKAAVFKF